MHAPIGHRKAAEQEVLPQSHPFKDLIRTLAIFPQLNLVEFWQRSFHRNDSWDRKQRSLRKRQRLESSIALFSVASGNDPKRTCASAYVWAARRPMAAVPRV